MVSVRLLVVAAVLLALATPSSALARILPVDFGFRNSEMQQRSDSPDAPTYLSSPFVSPLLAAWTRPRRLVQMRRVEDEE